MIRLARRSIAAATCVVAGLFGMGADCAPGVGIGEAAECCTCLSVNGPDGEEADAKDNCLPDDLSQGLDDGIEEQQCSADAADAITGAGRVKARPECRAEGHPCGGICAAAAKSGVFFIE